MKRAAELDLLRKAQAVRGHVDVLRGNAVILSYGRLKESMAMLCVKHAAY